MTDAYAKKIATRITEVLNEEFGGSNFYFKDNILGPMSKKSTDIVREAAKTCKKGGLWISLSTLPPPSKKTPPDPKSQHVVLHSV